jgi:hypothetical protein
VLPVELVGEIRRQRDDVIECLYNRDERLAIQGEDAP